MIRTEYNLIYEKMHDSPLGEYLLLITTKVGDIKSIAGDLRKQMISIVALGSTRFEVS
jgi:hypothetical protein